MVAAVCICGAAVAFSAESPDPAAGPVGGDPGAKSSRGPSGEASQRDPLLQEAKRASQQAADAAEKHRASAEGKQERSASKTAFRGMSSEDARALYWKKFPKLAEKAAWRPLAAFAGDEIDVLSPFSAVVKTDRTRPGHLLTSDGVPLGVQEDGRYRPADARLTSTDDAFRPRASVVGTRIGKRLSTGVTIDQVTMTLVDAEDVTGVEVDDKVFYANVEQDTDLVVVTTPTGIETFAQLRTPESPEREKFAIGMPQGATLQATQDGGAEIVADRQKLAKVHPPQAVDAQGRRVPVEMAVEGEHLIVTTHHRDGDFAYPVVSDPALTDYWNSGGDKWDGAGEWYNHWYSGTEMSFPPSGSFGDGRYIHAPPGIHYNGSWGEWALPAYGQSFFSRAWFYDNILQYNSPERGRDQHWFDLNSGIWSRQQGRWTDVRNWGGETLWGDDVEVAPGAAETVSDLLVMQLLSHASFGRDHWTGAFVGGVVAAQEDNNVPVMTRVSPGPETRDWIRGGTTSLTASAQDVGLGVKHMGVYRPGGHDVQTHSCSGHQRSRCPHNLNDVPWRWNVDSWPEGVNRLGVHSTDIIGRQSEQRHWDAKIDRTGPRVELGGSAYRHRVDGPDNDQLLHSDSYSLTVGATDGVLSPSTNAERRAGVASVRLERRASGGWLNVSGWTPPGTADNQPLASQQVTVRPGDYPEGRQEWRVTAVDRAGNQSSESFWLDVLHRGYVYNGQVYVDDPSIDPMPWGREWAMLERPTSRWEEPDSVSTRSAVACSAASGTCAEYRQRSRHSEFDSTEADQFVRYRGTSEHDDRISTVGDMRDIVNEIRAGVPDGAGPIQDVRFTWQRLPSIAGERYQYHENIETLETAGTEVDEPDSTSDAPSVSRVRVRMVVDGRTKLPIRETVYGVADGRLVSRRIWSYGADRVLPGALGSEFFTVARPTNVEQEKSVEFDDAVATVAQSDTDTGAAFDAMSVSADLEVQAGKLCFQAFQRVKYYERPIAGEGRGAGGDLVGDSVPPRASRSLTHYGLSTAQGRCVYREEPAVTIRSTAKGSALGRAWKAAYRGAGRPVGNSVAPAYSLTIGATRRGAYFEKGGTAVVITGPFASDEVAAVINAVDGGATE